MVFLKPLKDLKFTDIERLKANKTCESPILDYKEQLLEDNKFLKQVSSFANTQGGFLVFGVTETGKGGYPKDIPGIDTREINKERMEQIILGNIQPRLNVRIRSIPHQDPSKAIIVIQIPNSYLKPHMNNRDNKFYKRYNFEAEPMTEIEVSDTYRRRFTGYQEVESYVSRLLEHQELVMSPVVGRIILVPTIMQRMIDTFNMQDFDWINQIKFKHKYYHISIIPSRPKPSPNGVKCLLRNRDGNLLHKLEIHRNGCIDCTSYFGEVLKEGVMFLYHIFCIMLFQVLQFASTLYQRYNYFGDTKIICNLRRMKGSLLPRLDGTGRMLMGHPCQIDEINILREVPTSMVELDYEYIVSGIMGELFNSFEVWKCPLFDSEGKFKESMLYR